MVPKVCFEMCDVRDVAAAHIKAMTSPKAPGKKKNVNVNPSWGEFAILKRSGLHVISVRVVNQLFLFHLGCS